MNLDLAEAGKTGGSRTPQAEEHLSQPPPRSAHYQTKIDVDPG